MKTKLIVLTLVVAITVVFLGFAQSSYAQQNTPLANRRCNIKKSVFWLLLLHDTL
ncbi:unnamed protein product, partial [marine sediment metagenome]